MSTKSSLKFERDDATGELFHLYNEIFDDDYVYLEVEGFHFEAASSMDLSGKWGPRLTLKLPNAWARKLGLIGDDFRRRPAEGPEEASEPGLVQGTADDK
jgi:hypothetical protein